LKSDLTNIKITDFILLLFIAKFYLFKLKTFHGSCLASFSIS